MRIYAARDRSPDGQDSDQIYLFMEKPVRPKNIKNGIFWTLPKDNKCESFIVAIDMPVALFKKRFGRLPDAVTPMVLSLAVASKEPKSDGK